jgi:hypothetical protein
LYGNTRYLFRLRQQINFLFLCHLCHLRNRVYHDCSRSHMISFISSSFRGNFCGSLGGLCR